MEKKYCAVYKCQLCGELIIYGEPFESTYDQLSSLCSTAIKSQQFINNPALHKIPMYMLHKCQGGCGIAQFAGFIEYRKA